MWSQSIRTDENQCLIVFKLFTFENSVNLCLRSLRRYVDLSRTKFASSPITPASMEIGEMSVQSIVILYGKVGKDLFPHLVQQFLEHINRGGAVTTEARSLLTYDIVGSL